MPQLARRKPKISVIIPIYNMELWLEECILSVLHQTFYDLEVLCVDDGSTDNSIPIVEEFALQDHRIQLIHRQANGGPGAARNSGIRAASGKYLFFLDADDVLYDELSLQHLYDIAIDHQADQVIGGVYKWHTDTGELFQDNHAHYLRQELRQTSLQQNPELRRNVVVWNKLLRRSFLDKHHITFFNDALRRFEDNPYSWKIHLSARKTCVTLRPTYLFRQPAGKADYFLHKIYPHLDYLSEVVSELHRFFSVAPFRARRQRHLVEALYAGHWVVAANNQNLAEKITLEDKTHLCLMYTKLLSGLPEKSLKRMPGNICKAAALAQEGNYHDAWQMLVHDPQHKKQTEHPLLLPLHSERFASIEART